MKREVGNLMRWGTGKVLYCTEDIWSYAEK